MNKKLISLLICAFLGISFVFGKVILNNFPSWIKGSCQLEGVVFQKSFELKGSGSFKNCVFEEEVCFSGSVDCQGCKFKKNAVVSGDIHFDGCYFFQGISWDGVLSLVKTEVIQDVVIDLTNKAGLSSGYYFFGIKVASSQSNPSLRMENSKVSGKVKVLGESGRIDVSFIGSEKPIFEGNIHFK